MGEGPCHAAEGARCHQWLPRSSALHVPAEGAVKNSGNCRVPVPEGLGLSRSSAQNCPTSSPAQALLREGWPAIPARPALTDLLPELHIYSLLCTLVVSRGRYGRTRGIILDLPDELVEKIDERIRIGFEAGKWGTAPFASSDV